MASEWLITGKIVMMTNNKIPAFIAGIFLAILFLSRFFNSRE